MGLFDKLFNREMKDTTPQTPTNTSDTRPTNSNGNFHFIVEDVFTITGRGTVVTGRVDTGEVHVGDTVTISGRRQTQVTGVEMFRKTLDYARAGDNCGILLKDISREDINRGDYLSK
jgi:elongation factor Tu